MDSDSDGEEVCPLCCNELDATDLNFLPCPCGYQVCLYCYGRLEKDFNSRCPACRNEYGEGRYKITNPAELLKYVKKFTKELEGRKALRKKRQAERKRQKAFQQAESKRQQMQLFQRMSAQQQQQQQQQQKAAAVERQQQSQGSNGQLQNNGSHLTPLQRQQIAELRQRKIAQHQSGAEVGGKREGYPNHGSFSSSSASQATVQTNVPHAKGLASSRTAKAQTSKIQASSTAGTKTSSSKPPLTPAERRALVDVRVIQYNLVYVIGLSPKIANEETLRSHEYFGQYGKIVKLVVNRSHMRNGAHNSASAYITYEKKEAARESIASVNGFYLDERTVKASFGTTKYCNMFLKGLTCVNPDCLYLHHRGDESDSFTKEQMQQVRVSVPVSILSSAPCSLSLSLSPSLPLSILLSIYLYSFCPFPPLF